MTDTPDTAPRTTTERIAKVIARAGLASRRDAEKMILAGRVSVNGVAVTSPALDVAPTDKVVVDGKPIDAPQETRLWLYYKPLGLVTTEKDEQGRRTIFDEMPAEMPRVMNVGRLDLNSEGLLLLTNDGGLKRRLELPDTAWLRKYRVRVNGRPTDDTFAPLRNGVTIDGETFLPMEITLDRQQGANAWLTIGLREGRNREIRRAMTEIGLTVNRLIRVSYGPFRLNEMQPGDVVEVRRKVLRDQLGDKLLTGEEGGRPALADRNLRTNKSNPRPTTPRRIDDDARKPDDGRKGFGRQRDFSAEGERKPRWNGEKGAKPARAEGFRSHRDDRPEGEARKPYTPRAKEGFKPRSGEFEGFKPRGDRPARAGGDDRKPYTPRSKEGYAPRPRDGETEGFRPRTPRPEGEARKPYAPRGKDGFKPRSSEGFAPRKDGEARKPYTPRPKEGFKPRSGEFEGFKPRGDRPARAGGDDRKPYTPRTRDGEKEGYRPRTPRAEGDAARKPYSPRPKEGFSRREDGGAPQSSRKPAFKSQGFKSHGSARPRAAGYKSHGSAPRGPKKD